MLIKHHRKNVSIIDNIHTVAAIMLVFLFMACSTIQVEEPDPIIYRGNIPRSILVMPPVNLTPDINAPVTFLATSTMPLAEAGYYVIPVTLSDATFKQNGVTVAEEAHALPHSRLHEIFGADAALYITITRFGTRFFLINSVVEAEVSAKLVDIRNSREIWSGHARSTSGENEISVNSFENLIAAMITATISQIANTIFDQSYIVGKEANNKLLSAGGKNRIQYGPRHPRYGTIY